MDLSVLKIPEKKEKQLNKAGISSVDDLLYYYPRKYQDRTALTGLLLNGEESTFLFHFDSIRYIGSRTPLIKAYGTECATGFPVEILWWNQSYLFERLQYDVKKTVLVSGMVTYVSGGYNNGPHYEVNTPTVFDTGGEKALGLYPIYRKVPGMAAEYLQNCIDAAFRCRKTIPETVPPDILRANSLMGHDQMVQQLHYPVSAEQLEEAQRRKRWDDLLYFALRIELNQRRSALGSAYGLPLTRTMNTILANLPFQLTKDQMEAVMGPIATARTGRRINALIQGDVGCGKTIVASLLMIAFAENGHQAVLMAPTQLLASQHYESLKKLVVGYGIPVAFVSGQKLRKAEQKDLEEKLANGYYKLIVGTQALISSSYQFHSLALVIEDEEHKYGVMQREAMAKKAAGGTHTITMSATPIPRSLAQTLYGDGLQLYSIRTKPAGRQPVNTGMASSMEQLFRFLVHDIQKRGHQAYVVCPMVTSSEKVEGVTSVEETYELYRSTLEPHGIRVGMVTGKTKKTDAAQILQAFERNEISVLVSTTVIEVGINVPNATCIVIHNAERFGLAQLHQLRGRVGRGGGTSFCVLVSEDKHNPRLEAMCNHSDGFEIAEMDLKLRGAGDFLGTHQSGTERYLALALEYPEEYRQAQEAASNILDSNYDCAILDTALRDQAENRGGEIVA